MNLYAFENTFVLFSFFENLRKMLRGSFEFEKQNAKVIEMGMLILTKRITRDTILIRVVVESQPIGCNNQCTVPQAAQRNTHPFGIRMPGSHV